MKGHRRDAVGAVLLVGGWHGGFGFHEGLGLGLEVSVVFGEEEGEEG